jgi:hypothetical protein
MATWLQAEVQMLPCIPVLLLLPCCVWKVMNFSTKLISL